MGLEPLGGLCYEHISVRRVRWPSQISLPFVPPRFLQGNGIGSQGAVELAGALKVNRALEKLSLGGE